MANIFRTKEVYKRLKGVPNDQNPLRAVRGVYVCGDYTEPYYISPVLQISDIQTTKAVVVNFTTSYTHSYEDSYSIAMTDISSNDFTITRFSKAYASSYENSYNIAMTDITSGKFDVLYYGKAYTHSYENSYNIAMTEFNSKKFDYLLYKTEKLDVLPEPTLRIKSIETTIASIENVIE